MEESLQAPPNCPNCKAPTNIEWNFCPICHTQLKKKITETGIEYTPTKAETRLFNVAVAGLVSPVAIPLLASMLVAVLTSILSNDILAKVYIFLMAFLTPICFITGVVILIYGVIKHPKYKRFGKTLRLLVVGIILAVALLFLAVALFSKAFNDLKRIG